jgi:hypothetical protein
VDEPRHGEQPDPSGADQSIWGMTHAPDSRVATPAALAREAYERGDQLFQIDLIVSAIQGAVDNTAPMTRTVRSDPGDVLGAIEAQGWRLEHVSTSFVETGSTSVKKFFSDTGALVANHGHLVALYVFRRAARG